ncbi:MAG: hypothetical protein OXH57_02595 [Ekhidna sp.]|nr:hypothetical protein [Ekhidna sp.]
MMKTMVGMHYWRRCRKQSSSPTLQAAIWEVRSPVVGTFQLLSLSGKPLLEGTINTRLDITSLRSGLYLVATIGRAFVEVCEGVVEREV